MPRASTRHRTRTVLTTTAAGALAAVAVLATSGAAHATTLKINYDVNGSSVIAKPNSTVALGPAILSTEFETSNLTFTGHLLLPDTRTSFKALGLLPTTATVKFKEAAPATGKLSYDASGRLTASATATYYIQLRDIKVAGLPVFEGPNCQTAAPVSIPVGTPAGEGFQLVNGGNLTGTYTIGKFQNCGFTTGLLNLLVPGPNNTARLVASNGRQG